MDGLADVRIEVHGVDEVDLGEALAQRLDRAADVQEAFAEVLSAVPCDQYESAALVEAVELVACLEEVLGYLLLQRGITLDALDDLVQGIDDGIARHEDVLVADAFGQ